MPEEIVINELGEEIKNGKGCIVLDFACYFPYANQDSLEFKFKLGEEELEPYKHNHRFPNKGYVTISKKMGRRVSKLGYPVFVDLNERCFIVLGIEFGVRGKRTVKLIFPVNVKLTKDKPVCNLSLRFNFDELTFEFGSYREDGEGFHRETVWTNDETYEYENAVILSPPTQVTLDTVMYKDELTPHPQTFEHFMC